MEPLFPHPPWMQVGLPAQSRVSRLLYNRPANCLVAVASQEGEGGITFGRLYYRHLPRETYDPVAAYDLLESQAAS